MTKRLPDKNPDLLTENFVKRLWFAVIKQAKDDLKNGGWPAHSPESPNTKHRRVLEAYHWLLTERSDLAFEIHGTDPENFREAMRKAIRSGAIVVDLNRPPDKRRVAVFPSPPRPPRRRQAKIAA